MAKKHQSGISYARAAKKFGVDIDTVRQYAQNVKEYRKVALKWAREHQVSDIKLGKGLAALAKADDARAAFLYYKQDIERRLAEPVRETLDLKLTQYIANIKAAVSEMPASKNKGTIANRFLRGLNSGQITPTDITAVTGGSMLQRIYKKSRSGVTTLSYDTRPLKDVLVSKGLL